MIGLSIESQFEAAKMLFDYLTKMRGYNMFLIDEIDGSKVSRMRKFIDEGNKIEAVKLYRQLDREVDAIRDRFCYNELPERSSFRGIAKDLYRELKESWLLYTDEFHYLGRILRFISTSDYYVIREYLMKRSYSMYNYKDIPLDPDSFYCGYVPLEALMDYILKLYIEISKLNCTKESL